MSGTDRTVTFTPANLLRMTLVEATLAAYVEEPWRFRYLTAKVAARAITDDTFMEFLIEAGVEPMPDDDDVKVVVDEEGQ